VRALVSQELGNLNEVITLGSVPYDQTLLGELPQEVVAIANIVGQNFGLDSLRSILKPPIPIGYRPQPGEQQPGKRLTFRKLLGGEKPWLNVSRPCQFSLPAQHKTQIPQTGAEMLT